MSLILILGQIYYRDLSAEVKRDTSIDSPAFNYDRRLRGLLYLLRQRLDPLFCVLAHSPCTASSAGFLFHSLHALLPRRITQVAHSLRTAR